MAIFFAPRKAEASSVDHWFSRMSLMGGGQRSVSVCKFEWSDGSWRMRNIRTSDAGMGIF
ncbi:unnamed protein product [Fusarium graminearum]|nr:unnamed protein product [Fusarium graminearum]CAG1985798.1 unnamed protein product [Fusarium graminearum]